MARKKTMVRIAQRDLDRVAVPPAAAVTLASQLLAAAGASTDAALAVATHLVDSDRAGLHSHGLMRVSQYLDEIASGELDPAATPAHFAPSAGRIDVDGNRGFGQVAANAAVALVTEAARGIGVAVATVRRTGHAGRIGAYVESTATAGFLGIAFCSGPRAGHRVAPFGGVDARLATNPIAFAFPTEGEPVVADFSTSAVPEGVVRRLRDLGLAAPDEALQDHAGRPTTAPAVLYDRPPGTLLPLGGRRFGHKGYALGLLVEVLATTLAGDDSQDESRYGNNLALIAIAIDDGFAGRATALSDYIRSSSPVEGSHRVLLPGDPERLARSDRLMIDGHTWSRLEALAKEYGVSFPKDVE